MERTVADSRHERDPRGAITAQFLGPSCLATCDGLPWSLERQIAARLAQARLWAIVAERGGSHGHVSDDRGPRSSAG